MGVVVEKGRIESENELKWKLKVEEEEEGDGGAAGPHRLLCMY